MNINLTRYFLIDIILVIALYSMIWWINIPIKNEPSAAYYACTADQVNENLSDQPNGIGEAIKKHCVFHPAKGDEHV